MKENEEIRIGTIVSLSKDRGFGFVESPNSTNNTFFHFTNVIADPSLLKEGMKVSYTIKKGKRGIECNHVKTI